MGSKESLATFHNVQTSHSLGEEHCQERAHQYGKTPDLKKEEGVERANHKAPTSENSLQTDDTDNKEVIDLYSV